MINLLNAGNETDSVNDFELMFACQDYWDCQITVIDFSGSYRKIDGDDVAHIFHFPEEA